MGAARHAHQRSRLQPRRPRRDRQRISSPRSRFFADSREGVLQQGAEFLRAKQAGLIDDDHILAEIGQVLAGTAEGRRTPEEITIYKSLGHIVQDLASAWWLYSQPERAHLDWCRHGGHSKISSR